MAIMNGITALKTAAKYILAPLLYRFPPSELAPEHLYLYLHQLILRQQVPGDIVEVGCHLAGTAIIAAKMLWRLEIKKRYRCYDTFGGFVGTHFQRDVIEGTPPYHHSAFSANSKHLVERILRKHSAQGIELIGGDIATLPDQQLPEAIAVCLIDVDLSEPTYLALKRLYPRLSTGGVILVDDCPVEGSWKAWLGYRRFAAEIGLPERYEYGMGIVEKVPAAT